MQDAAYGTLLRSQDVSLCTLALLATRPTFPRYQENNPEVIARHYAEAGLALEAIVFGNVRETEQQKDRLTEKPLPIFGEPNYSLRALPTERRWLNKNCSY